MQQHPQYWENTQKDLDDLYALLSSLERYGFMHQDMHENIRSLMYDLQYDAIISHAKSKQGIVGFKDGDDPFEGEYPEVHTIYDSIEEKNKPQFIQDLRNVIAHCICSPSLDGIADEIIKMRDIEYYKLHLWRSG
jgi:hypothetical protein